MQTQQRVTDSRTEQEELAVALLNKIAEVSRNSIYTFTRYMRSYFEPTPFHETYYKILELFAHGDIRRLIVTVPPQHGKSEGSTRILPAYLLGRNPNLRIAIASYSGTFAKKFNREIQRLIDTPEYRRAFKETMLNSKNVATIATAYLRNANEFEIVNKRGSLKAVGRGGPLTGNPVDVMLMDDLYKDAAEGNSPTIREAVWDWYLSVVKTRLHNNSQELIVFTRWHEEDLVGRLSQIDNVKQVQTWDDIKNVDADTWVHINFEAIKTGEPTELDNRPEGTPLWPERHSLKLLNDKRKLDAISFNCLYQGSPGSLDGRLFLPFRIYHAIEDVGTIIDRCNYTDAADEGNDYLCSICYTIVRAKDEMDVDGRPMTLLLVTDVIYTQAPMEETERTVPDMLNRNNTATAYVESNNGGRGFARNVQKATRAHVEWFFQGDNKESRITTNYATVNRHVRFPLGWETRWPNLYNHLTKFLKKFKANTNDDGADVVTGMVEKHILTPKARGIRTRL